MKSIAATDVPVSGGGGAAAGEWSGSVAVARRAAVAGLAVADRHRDGPILVESKGAVEDIVTDIDVLAEQAMVEIIAAAFPDDAITGEETTRIEGTGGRAWRVDPLDGTHNYAYGLPLYGVAVSLLVEGLPTVACIAHGRSVATVVRGEAPVLEVDGRKTEQGTPVIDRRPSAALWLGYGGDRTTEPVRTVLRVLDEQVHRTFEHWAPTVDALLYLRGGIDVVVGHRCAGEELPAVLLLLQEAGAEIVDIQGRLVLLDAVPDLFLCGRPAVVAGLRPIIEAALA